VDPDRLGATDQAPEVLWILHPIEGQDEGGLSAAHRSRQDLFWGNLWAASNHQRDPLVPVKPCELADQRPFNFNNWDAQRGRMEDNLLQRGATLWNYEEFDRLTTSRECLLHRVTPRDQLLIGADESERLHGDGALGGPVARAVGAWGPTTCWWTHAEPWCGTLARACAWSRGATLFVH
jgi:hypothetical protein